MKHPRYTTRSRKTCATVFVTTLSEGVKVRYGCRMSRGLCSSALVGGLLLHAQIGLAQTPLSAPAPSPPADIATLGPRELSFREPIPAGYRPVQRTNVLVIGIGLGVFGLAYKSTVGFIAESLLFGGFEHAKAQLPILVPVVGPLLIEHPRPLELVLGGVQALGLVVGVAGFVFPRTILLRNDYRDSRARTLLYSLRPVISPQALGVRGQF